MFKKNKNKIIISSLVIIGVTLILIASFQEKSKGTNTFDDYCNELELKIEAFLKNVEGIEDVNVIVTLEPLEKSDSFEDVFNSESTEEVSLPQVRGVAVACTNGDNYEMQKKVTDIITSYLGISSKRVKIVAIKWHIFIFASYYLV